MRRLRSAIAAVAMCAAISLWVSCGSSKQALVSVSVLPAAAVATSGSGNDAVLFTAYGNYSTYDNGYMSLNAAGACAAKVPDSTKALNADWSTSDATNTSIDSKGVAICLAATPTPATITASVSGICGAVRSTASLTCN